MIYEEFCSIWLPLGEQLLGTAAGMLGSREDAEDALQDLYIRLWQKRDSLEDVDNRTGYAVRILKNICIDRIRARRQSPEITLEDGDFISESSTIENRERIKTVGEAISKLPASQRRILEMRTIQGFSYDEISEITGMSPLTLRVLLSRARKTLRKFDI